MSEKQSVTVVGLDDASDIARTISNKTSQLIIDFVKKNKGVTATKIAKELSLPASTVHYNISALLKAKILDDSSFHYSSKGKQVSHFEVSDQVIIIVPDKVESSISSQLKTLLPGIFSIAAVAGVWLAAKTFSVFSSGSATIASADYSVAFKANDAALLEAAPRAASYAVPSSEPNSALLIFIGILIGFGAVALGMILYSYIKRKAKQ